MAFDESFVLVSSLPVVEETDGFHHIRNSLSRLSICTSSSFVDQAVENQPDFGVFTSENFDGAEADGEVSDDGVSECDSDKETPVFYSLPVTPSRRRRKSQVTGEFDATESKKYGRKCNLRRQRRVIKGKKKNGINGESDGSGGVGLTVLTREKSMRMGLEEVKACRDLGFELEAPGRISVSTTQTSSGGNSPIATWRISSPGDDPKEVKARLKIWAQAVALASATRQA